MYHIYFKARIHNKIKQKNFYLFNIDREDAPSYKREEVEARYKSHQSVSEITVTWKQSARPKLSD